MGRDLTIEEIDKKLSNKDLDFDLKKALLLKRVALLNRKEVKKS